MAGTDVPAIDGPAGQERSQEASDAAVVVVEGVDFVEGDAGCLAATWWPW